MYVVFSLFEKSHIYGNVDIPLDDVSLEGSPTRHGGQNCLLF